MHSHPSPAAAVAARTAATGSAPASATVPHQPGPARGKRPAPERNDDFDHLALDELRAYRDELADEETRVSYWRRVLQARVDLVRADGSPRAEIGSLRKVLGGRGLPSRRTALVRVVPADGLPPLPDLAQLWSRDPMPGDEASNASLLARLVAAESELSEYRRSLHERIDAATGELVARYRERPALAVRALPLTPPFRPRVPSY